MPNHLLQVKRNKILGNLKISLNFFLYLTFDCAAALPLNCTSREWQRIAFLCRSIDKITRYGLPIKGITEFYGESGSGKSQICLQLALNVQMPIAYGGLEKSTVFICTEDAFPSKRLCQIAKFYTKEYKVKDNLLDNIFIEHINNSVGYSIQNN